MTPAELRELLAKATPGPWDDSGTDVWAKNKAGEYVGPLATFATRYEDAALVVALRNAAPALLDRVEALEGALQDALDREDRTSAGFPPPYENRRAAMDAARALLRDGEGSR